MQLKQLKDIFKKYGSIIAIVVLVLAIVLLIYFSPTFSSTTTVSEWDGSVSSSFAGGNGSIENPYLIESGSDFAYLKELLESYDADLYIDKHYKIIEDINFGSREFYIENNLSFTGSLNGDAHTIYNGIIRDGLFRSIENSRIEGINFQDSVVENTDNYIVGLITSESYNSVIENITLNDVVFEVNYDNFAGTIVGRDVNSTIRNIVINANYNFYTPWLYKMAYIINDCVGTEIENVLVHDNVNIDNKYFFEVGITESNITHYNNYTNLSDVFENDFNSGNYEYKIEDGKVVVAKVKKIVLPTFAFEEHNSGIENRTVYINDLEADYNYYNGLNFVTPIGSNIPTGDNRNLYGDNNLVPVQISYSGVEDLGDNVYTGTISISENQNKMVYYKYYSVENGKIKIPLIENPFLNRPDDKGFNNWVSDNDLATIYYDTELHERYALVNVTYTDGVPNPISLSFHASWVNASIYRITSTSNVWSTAFSNLDSKGMKRLVDNFSYLYCEPFDMTGYYYQRTANRNTNYSGYDVYGNYQNNARCSTTGGCDYYILITNEYYNENNEYYELNYIMRRVYESDIPRECETIINSDYVDRNMAGFYVEREIDRDASYSGLYDEDGNYYDSGICSSYYGCTYYELLQTTETNIFDIDKTYYFMVTRDTNIVVLNATNQYVWTNSHNKPFTFTGMHNGVDYRNNYYWNAGSLSIQIYNDTTIENLRIYSNVTSSTANPSSASNSTKVIYGNWRNLKLGRGMVRYSSTQMTFDDVFGGTLSRTGSASSPTKYKIIVESGWYNTITLTMPASGTSTYVNYDNYIDMFGVYGNDYDRITNNNDNLDVYFVASGSWSGQIRSYNNNYAGLKLTVKSGNFGRVTSDNTSGIYVGGRGYGTHHSVRSAKIEGGKIYNLIGGPLTVNTKDTENDTFMYITGGEIDMVIGGAGTSTTYGNRIISATGGRINYSIFGGSNSYDGATTDGTLTGSSFIYAGGTAQIGNQTYVNNNNTLWGVEAGSIFGVGNGRSGSSYTALGTADNSYVVVDNNANILRNIYGGGNYGSTGTNVSGTKPTSTTIDLRGGTVHGDVYGGGNQNGAGKNNTKIATITINANGGTVNGSIYGGANISGVVYGSTNLNINKGTIGSVYGGGKGNATYVQRDVLVNIGNNSEGPTISKDVNGGSAFGTVNNTTANTTRTNYTTKTNVYNGVINGSVFGGGEGNNTYTPYVAGDITVTVEDGNIGYVYGGNDQAGTPNGDVLVYLNGGIIGESYGGGNRSSVRNTEIYLQGAKTTYLFGGSNTSGTVTSSKVTVTSGEATYVYGGNNIGGSLGTSNVYINGGTVTEQIYGGGNEVLTTTTNLYLNNLDNTVNYAFGGGRSANVTTANVYQNGAPITNLFGGSNTAGTVNRSNVKYSDGNVTNVYGGNNAGGITTTAVIDVTAGTITNLFGGGNQTASGTATININHNSSTTKSIDNVYGGGNQAGITTTTINLNKAKIGNVYGGSNVSGTVQNTTVNINTSNVIADNVYGGNNAGGLTMNPKVIVNNGTIGTIYGGGNLAETTKADVDIFAGTIDTVYGGGNEAAVTNNTDLDVLGGIISSNIYGGGNYGTVGGNTLIYVNGVTVGGSIYAGGNGATAVVSGNTEITVDGNTVVGTPTSKAPHFGSVFGGGNAAATGSQSSNNSKATVNIAEGTIYGNVYGGANTSVVYGQTAVNIGVNTIANYNLTSTSLMIRGTIFGGGEANAAGSEEYDYSFISVTNGIGVNIDGSGYTNFEMKGSIFGSGNASSTTGTSSISIKNYGTISKPQNNISIQRTNTLTIDNSALVLTGATDRTNEFSDVLFSLSIIDDLKLKNNSTLFLHNGANLLKKFESLTAGNQYAVVTIDENTGAIAKNVDNRIYMLEGKNLNIATNESVTSYGEVYGMTFFGMFTPTQDENVNMGIYDPSIGHGDELDWGMMPTRGSYVLGLHAVEHNIQVDGFYSNFMKQSSETNEIKYIIPQPEDSNFYMWVIGEAVIEYEIDLTASKFSTLGTAELPFLEFSKPNTSFQVIGFDYGSLNNGVSLVDSSTIPRVAPTNEIANTTMGLSMKSGSTGWLNKGETKFFTDDPEYTDTTYFVGENTADVPSLLFYLYHSKNINVDDDLGTVAITIMATTKVDALTMETERLVIYVNLHTALYQNNDYEGSMTAGREYDMFTSTLVNITNDSSLSAYYALYAEENVYKTGYHRVLVSNYILPVGTKITMIDFVNEVPVYYSYVINQTDFNDATAEFALHNEASYKFSKFTKMGSINSNDYYNDEAMNSEYCVNNISSEEFIFIVDFEDANIPQDKLGNSLAIELRDNEGYTMISVLGIQHQNLVYNVYANQDALIDVSGVVNPTTLYIGHSATLNITTSFVNNKVGSNTIYDTRYFDSKLGINISLVDNNGNIVNGTSLMGVSFIMDGVRYYPNLDGSTRIKISERVGNVANWLTIDTTNSTLPTGNYKIQIESFGSPDGIYYGLESSDIVDIPILIINEIYGLDSKIKDYSVIIDAETGKNINETNELDYVLTYSSGLSNPNVRMKLYRRNYDTAYATNYTLVDLNDYLTVPQTATSNEKEYLITNSPQSTNEIKLMLGTNLKTGTYRVDFCLYDAEIYIGKVSRYIIIK